MAMRSKIPLCLAITLGVCLSVITTEAIPNEDVIVPEEELSKIDDTDLSHFTGLTQQPPSATLRAKVCENGHKCTYHVEIQSTASEQDDDHASGNDFDRSNVEFYLVVSPGTAQGTFDLSCKSFHKSDTDPATGEANIKQNTDDRLSNDFQECLNESTRAVIQSNDGSLEMMVEQNPNQIGPNNKCAGHMQEIQNIFAGTVEQLAGVYASADDESLIQFSETVQDANGKRTTHYRREQHENGSMTVHRRHSWDLEASKHPQPVLMQGSQQSLTMSSDGSNNFSANGTPTGSDETTTNKLGAASPKTGFSCTGSTTPDAEGKSCNAAGTPANVEEAQTVRIENDTNEGITLVSSEPVTDLVQKPTLNEFLQGHTAAGRIRIPLLKAIRAKPVEKQPEDPVNAEQGFAAFVELLEEANASDFEPGQIRNEITRLMESPKIRRLTVDKLSKNEIKNGRAVQSLMHAIGRAATQQVEAVDQLIELGGSASVNEDARSQAIVALLQAKCYNHDYAIRRLATLAKPNPQTFMQIMSLHVQHALMGHAEHCANSKYTDASANKYNDILSQSRKHLANAAANKDDGSTWILLDAIGNTNSQSPRETEAVASVANNDQLAAQTRLLAVRTLGRLYTDGALAALRKLSSSSDSEMQKAAEKAIAGEHLHLSDARKPPPSEVNTNMSMAQSTAQVEGLSEMRLTREKTFPTPERGDIRAEPKVGVELFRNTNKGDNPFCLHGYAGVDGKAWSFTVSLIQAGGLKCKGYKFYQYLSILGNVIWSKQRGNSGKEATWKEELNLSTFTLETGQTTQSGQLSQAGDQQGYCGMNVDNMDLVATIAYDKNFLDETKYLIVGGFTISGTIILNGEVGLKVGWGNMVRSKGSGSHKDEARCNSGEMVFAIPYAQATLEGVLALDLLVTRGGGGVKVTLVKFSMPAISETMSDSTCGGVYFKLEGLGGKVYGFIDVIKEVSIKVKGCWCCFWEWEVSRHWSRKWTHDFYKWDSPAVWTSNELKCEGAAASSSSGGGGGGKVRFQHGDGLTVGTVQVLENGAWGTVCDDRWDNNDAAVVCRQLGFVGGSPAQLQRAKFGQGSGSIMYDDVNCAGNEATLASCPKGRAVGSHNCGHSEDAGVDCRSATSGVRLVGGAGVHEGTVQVWVNGAWGTVCDDSWDDTDAAVVCKQLGFSGGTQHQRAKFGQGSGSIMYDDVHCTGNEANLASCHKGRGVGSHNCGHSEDAGVTCTH